MKPAILAKLIDMAGRDRDRAGVRRARAEEARARAEGTLGLLRQYRQAHHENRDKAAGTLGGADGLAVHARFGTSLETAIRAQQEQCTALATSAETHAGDLRRAHARVQALRALAQRRERARQRRSDMIEQHQQDEMAAARHPDRKTGR